MGGAHEIYRDRRPVGPKGKTRVHEVQYYEPINAAPGLVVTIKGPSMKSVMGEDSSSVAHGRASRHGFDPEGRVTHGFPKQAREGHWERTVKYEDGDHERWRKKIKRQEPPGYGQPGFDVFG